MDSTEIRIAPYMTLVGEFKETRDTIKRRKFYKEKVEFYSRGDEWFVIIYYNDGDETANKLPDSYIPGGWLDINQAMHKFLIENN